MSDLYWIAFKINEDGCDFVPEGPYFSHDEAMMARERMKARSRFLLDIVTIPFIAKDEKEAGERAKFF